MSSSKKQLPSYRNRIGYHAGLLGGVGLIASMAIVIADVETRSAIIEAKANDQKASLEQVIPSSLHSNDLLADVLLIPDEHGEEKKIFLARDDSGKVIAAAYEMVGYGYAGAISLIMGIDRDGNILGVRTLSHSETPGLGDKIELAKDDWVLSFDGKSLSNPSSEQWGVQKDGGIFDQFTGATITPRVYVKTVKAGLSFFEQHKIEIVEKDAPILDTDPLDEMGNPSTAAPSAPVKSGRNANASDVIPNVTGKLSHDS